MRKYSPFTLLAITSLSVTLVILVCIQFVDGNVAVKIWKFTSSHPEIHNRIKEISSPLPALVAIITALLWLIYYVMSRTAKQGQHAQFIKLVATAIPVAFLTKAILQYAFGRTNTRAWLEYGVKVKFAWFNPAEGSSFPSGHMIVFSALLTAGWLHCPRLRPLALILLSALAAALLLSSYHFVSDIIAGGYCGVLLTIGVDHFLSKNRAAGH